MKALIFASWYRNKLFRPTTAVFLFLLPLFLNSQDLKITILDPLEQPLVGAQAISSPTQNLYLSGERGVITIPSTELHNLTSLTITYVGYQDTTVLLDQQVTPLRIIMNPQQETLNEITVIGRLDQNRDDFVAQKLTIISAESIASEMPTTTADALTKSGEVYVQMSQLGGGSPVLRGFEANRILLVVDGVRLNNAIFRSGHLQNVISTDQNNLKDIEVISGPGSLVYGSDALGGVIHMRTKDPVPFSDQIKQNLNVSTNFASAASALMLHADYSRSGKKIGSITSAAFSTYGDLQSGTKGPEAEVGLFTRPLYQERINDRDTLLVNDKPYRQLGSGYHQIDLSQKLKWKLSESLFNSTSLQFSTSSNIPRYDQLNEYSQSMDTITASWAEWYYGPQTRFLALNKTDYYPYTRYADKISLSLSYQNLGESRHSRRFQREILSTTSEKLTILGLSLDVVKDIKPSLELLYGGDIYYNTLRSHSTDENILTNDAVESPISRYPNGPNGYLTSGIYSMVEYRKDKWRMQAGLRGSYVSTSIIYHPIDGEKYWPESYYDRKKGSTTDLSANFGLTYEISPSTKLAGKLSKAFRAPNIDDIAKIRVKGNQALVPNLNLTPENLYSVELGILGNQSAIRWNINAFYTYLDDAIVQMRSTGPDGSDQIEIEGVTYDTYANQNASSAYITGVSGMISVTRDKFSGEATTTYTYGESTTDGSTVPMAHIPPLYGKIAGIYASEPFRLEANLLFNAAKPKRLYSPDSADNLEYAGPDGTPSWYTINLLSSYTWRENLTIKLGVQNLLDRLYRPFASGINGAGINFMGGISYSLTK